jgi:hypothetical protein
MSQQESSYVDDVTIKDDAPLWRRVPPPHFIFDENRQAWRPSSAAFDDHPNGSPMSVLLGEDILAAGRTPESVLEGHEQFALVSFTAGLARAQQQGVMRKPLPEEPAHAEVFGRKTRAVKQAIARGSQWIVPPAAGNAAE